GSGRRVAWECVRACERAWSLVGGRGPRRWPLFSPCPHLVVPPAPPIHKALEEKVLAAEVITLIGRYGGGQNGDLTTDARGEVTFEGLIPGATYRLKKTKVEPNNEVIKEFTVEAGKVLELEVAVPGWVFLERREVGWFTFRARLSQRARNANTREKMALDLAFEAQLRWREPRTRRGPRT